MIKILLLTHNTHEDIKMDLCAKSMWDTFINYSGIRKYKVDIIELSEYKNIQDKYDIEIKLSVIDGKKLNSPEDLKDVYVLDRDTNTDVKFEDFIQKEPNTDEPRIWHSLAIGTMSHPDKLAHRLRNEISTVFGCPNPSHHSIRIDNMIHMNEEALEWSVNADISGTSRISLFLGTYYKEDRHELICENTGKVEAIEYTGDSYTLCTEDRMVYLGRTLAIATMDYLFNHPGYIQVLKSDIEKAVFTVPFGICRLKSDKELPIGTSLSDNISNNYTIKDNTFLPVLNSTEIKNTKYYTVELTDYNNEDIFNYKLGYVSENDIEMIFEPNSAQFKCNRNFVENKWMLDYSPANDTDISIREFIIRDFAVKCRCDEYIGFAEKMVADIYSTICTNPLLSPIDGVVIEKTDTTIRVIDMYKHIHSISVYEDVLTTTLNEGDVVNIGDTLIYLTASNDSFAYHIKDILSNIDVSPDHVYVKYPIIHNM